MQKQETRWRRIGSIKLRNYFSCLFESGDYLLVHYNGKKWGFTDEFFDYLTDYVKIRDWTVISSRDLELLLDTDRKRRVISQPFGKTPLSQET